jgi:hypothetical protein
MVTKENQRFLLVYKVMNDIVSNRVWCQSDYEGWKRVGVARKNNEVTWKFDITS